MGKQEFANLNTDKAKGKDKGTEKGNGGSKISGKEGYIQIWVFEDRVPKVSFTGTITGHMLDLGWRAMMKQYRLWKANLSKTMKPVNVNEEGTNAKS